MGDRISMVLVGWSCCWNGMVNNAHIERWRKRRFALGVDVTIVDRKAHWTNRNCYWTSSIFSNAIGKLWNIQCRNYRYSYEATVKVHGSRNLVSPLSGIGCVERKSWQTFSTAKRTLPQSIYRGLYQGVRRSHPPSKEEKRWPRLVWWSSTELRHQINCGTVVAREKYW